MHIKEPPQEGGERGGGEGEEGAAVGAWWESEQSGAMGFAIGFNLSP